MAIKLYALPGLLRGFYRRNRVFLIPVLVSGFVLCFPNSISAGAGVIITPLKGTVPFSDTSGTFSPLPAPEKGDWLAENEEKGQTFEQFRTGIRNEVDDERTTIYLQPIWNFKSGNGPPLEYLKKFTEVYFSLPVEMKRPIHPSEKKFSMRINPNSYNLQANADRILKYLMERVPPRAYCILGITMVDLYPDPLWNYVFGYATYMDRVGVFSFARYSPTFYNVSEESNPRLLFLRCCKILAHETGHMFGMAHCIDYRCVMNGCNSIKENDAQPIHLCPVCLEKLQCATSFDIDKRYKALAAFYKATGLVEEARWVENRCKSLK